MKFTIDHKFIAAVLLSLSTSGFSAINLETFKNKANESENTGRCIGARDINYCNGELDYALSKNLITKDAYNWGKTNEFYPVVNRRDVVEAICKCGCFDGETQILLSGLEGETLAAIKTITKGQDVMALSSEATLTDLSLDTFQIETVTQGPEENDMYVFTMENGAVLKLTRHHGVLLSTGEMIAAMDVDTSHKMLLAEDGSEVAVTKITREKPKGDVYNIDTDGDDNLNHIIVAEGILVGDVAWQNGLAAELGSIQIRQ